MAITQNLSRVRVESSAKNGTLGVQGVLNANQIKFDTTIATNNGNLVASPVFDKRHVVLRKGLSTEEFGLIQSVDVDGLTCTMQQDWVVPPASLDTYDVSYRLDDVATVDGCDFETDSRQWNLPVKRLIVGSTGLPGFLGMSHGQVLRVPEVDNITSGLRTGDEGIFCIGAIKNGYANLGGAVIFNDTADNQLSWDLLAGSTTRLYEFTLLSARNPDGVNSLDVTVDALSDVEWAKGQHYGVDSPFKITGVYVPIDGEGVEIVLGATVSWDGGVSTSIVTSILNTSGHPFVKVVLANGDVRNAHVLEVI